MELRQRKWDEETFQRVIQRELSRWPTGKEIDLEEAIEYHKAMPDERNAVKTVMRAQKEGNTPLICAVSGKPTVEKQIEELQYVGREADYFLLVSDSMTRKCRFKEAEEGLKRSVAEGKAYLNGFPYVIHGVRTSRTVLESINRPIYAPLPTDNCELTGITQLASGVTQFGSNWSTTVTADARAPLERIILCVQFIDRLIGYFQERGIPIMKRSLTISTGAPCPPSISLAASVIDCLMAAEQGLKYFGMFFPLNSCVLQDVAAIKVAPRLHQSYVQKLGYNDVDLSLGVGTATNTSAFPRDPSKGLARVLYDALIAAYAKAVRFHTKTGEEAFGIPTKESAIQAVKAVRMLCNMLKDEQFPESSEFEIETRMIELEARAILDKVLEVGDGDVVRGLVKALELGYIDIPYTCGEVAAGKCLAIRDANRAVRFLNHANIPLSKEMIDYHQEKIAERKQRDGQSDWDMIAKDLRAEANA